MTHFEERGYNQFKEATEAALDTKGQQGHEGLLWSPAWFFIQAGVREQDAYNRLQAARVDFFREVKKMCEANAYLRKQGAEDELFLEMVDRVVPYEEGSLLLEDIFGRRKIIRAKIVELALVDHKIILERE